jgi:hypothetical protein
LALQDRSAPAIEVVLGERECFLDAQASAPQDNEHSSYAPAVTVVGRVTHNRHDLVHHGRVGRVAHPLVAWRAAGVIARQGRRRTTAPRRVAH